MLLHHYLESSSRLWPDKIAVSLRDEAVTYADLNNRANIIATKLAYVLPAGSSNIGLYINKSPNAVAAIFGVLRTGSAYVPMDVDSPVQRTAYIVSDCAINIVITDQRNISKLAEIESLRAIDLVLVLVINAMEEAAPIEIPNNWKLITYKIGEACNAIVDSAISQDEPAYILYTSGSTGRPKGVTLSHRNAEVFVDWSQEYFNLGAEDKFASHAPFHFDLSIFDIFACIKVGGTLCLLPPGLAFFGDAITTFIRENRISVWYSVPLALVSILSCQKNLSENLASLRIVIYAGESLHFTKLNELRRYLHNCDICNLYGPTETNVITYYTLARESNQPLTENLPIGKPCPYARILIVDEQKNPVSRGVTGELVVNGASLMRGYWGDPKKTAEKIRHINLSDSSESFYFTGDIVYQNDDDEIIYLGRIDNMIKIRGFRVELGEIESALLAHERVNNAVVVAVQDDVIGHHLIAFVEPVNQTMLDLDEMINHCTDKLPAYMIPEKFKFLSKLPQNSTGKVDRMELKIKAQGLYAQHPVVA